MKRIHNREKEFTEIQRFKEENKKLKRQITQLRKIINKLDVERLETVKNILIEEEINQKTINRVEEKWKCFVCQKGTLKMFTINRLDGLHYYRICNICANRTKLKKWKPNIEE